MMTPSGGEALENFDRIEIRIDATGEGEATVRLVGDGGEEKGLAKAYSIHQRHSRYTETGQSMGPLANCTFLGDEIACALDNHQVTSIPYSSTIHGNPLGTRRRGLWLSRAKVCFMWRVRKKECPKMRKKSSRMISGEIDGILKQTYPNFFSALKDYCKGPG
jgi:hypothetical protein